jgi:hypothetical protein
VSAFDLALCIRGLAIETRTMLAIKASHDCFEAYATYQFDGLPSNARDDEQFCISNDSAFQIP